MVGKNACSHPKTLFFFNSGLPVDCAGKYPCGWCNRHIDYSYPSAPPNHHSAPLYCLHLPLSPFCDTFLLLFSLLPADSPQALPPYGDLAVWSLLVWSCSSPRSTGGCCGGWRMMEVLWEWRALKPTPRSSALLSSESSATDELSPSASTLPHL